MKADVMRIRERAKVEESWCCVKHLLNAEEHGVETIQKLAREMNEALELGDKETASMKLDQIQRLALLVDEIRRIRQNIVDLTFTFISEMKAEEIGGKSHVIQKEKERSSGEEGSGESDSGVRG